MRYRTRVIRMLTGNGYQPAPLMPQVFVARDGDVIIVPPGDESREDIAALARIEMELLLRRQGRKNEFA